jgi:hypothetical protein
MLLLLCSGGKSTSSVDSDTLTTKTDSTDENRRASDKFVLPASTGRLTSSYRSRDVRRTSYGS